MAKRMTRGEALHLLRGARVTGAVSIQMGHDRSWLSRALSGDPEGLLSPTLAQDILAALKTREDQ